MTTDLDLLVLGGYYGEGTHTQTYCTFTDTLILEATMASVHILTLSLILTLTLISRVQYTVTVTVNCNCNCKCNLLYVMIVLFE